MKNNRQVVSFFWFRRDLRLEDNSALEAALDSGYPVIAVFIFDSEILDKLEDPRDKRVTFIYHTLQQIDRKLREIGGGLVVRHGKPLAVWKQLLDEFDAKAIYANHDYEPYARERDKDIADLMNSRSAAFHTCKDQVVFEKSEILTTQEKPYTVYTPYRKSWQEKLRTQHVQPRLSHEKFENFLRFDPESMLTLKDIGFQDAQFEFPEQKLDEKLVQQYDELRDFPAADATTRLSVHLRFGTVSIRHLVRQALQLNEVWLSELIWREFFMQVLWHFPHVVDQPFKEKYAAVPWRDAPEDFEKWCQGKTGYPIVDAGMRELNETGFMHNRVRMVTASFLTKHLLLDWRLGERYFAEKLLDYDLSANNGNWQWAAGCGCDAAPYFRIFNPTTQIKKFDAEKSYIKKWIPELNTLDYPNKMVEHKFARQRALDAYKSVL